jgi:1-acyl-sn-glycerol-3-phosphate acyltransferase
VPCYLKGAHEAWPKGRLFPRPRSARLAIGAPRNYGHLKRGKEAAQEISRDLREAILFLRDCFAQEISVKREEP